MKIGILGGTFDPIHAGHIALAQAAKDQFELDKVLFIPAFIPPHKTTQRDLTPAPYRYRMVEMALRDHSGFELSDIELNRPDVSYTVDTLRTLKKKYPEAKLYLIVGADTLREIPHWHESETILQMAEFIAAPRPGSPSESPFKTGVYWIQMRECPISASGIREKIREGRAPGRQELPEGVEAYIARMNLYQKDKGGP